MGTESQFFKIKIIWYVLSFDPGEASVPLSSVFYFLTTNLKHYLNSISKDPTIDNFLGMFIFGYIKRSSDNVKTIIKMVHDYQTKESNIDLVRESHITEKAIIRNKVKPWLILCITFLPRSPVDIILEHH
jgi:hypothetical protein